MQSDPGQVMETIQTRETPSTPSGGSVYEIVFTQSIDTAEHTATVLARLASVGSRSWKLRGCCHSRCQPLPPPDDRAHGPGAAPKARPADQLRQGVVGTPRRGRLFGDSARHYGPLRVVDWSESVATRRDLVSNRDPDWPPESGEVVDTLRAVRWAPCVEPCIEPCVSTLQTTPRVATPVHQSPPLWSMLQV